MGLPFMLTRQQLCEAVAKLEREDAPRPTPKKKINFEKRASLRNASGLDYAVFSMALFLVPELRKNFDHYLGCTCGLITHLRKRHSHCQFVVHLSSDIDNAAVRLLSAAAHPNPIQLLRYRLPPKPGACWVVGALRFRTLWEWCGVEPVVVCDVHDDVEMLSEQLDALMASITEAQAEVGHSFWKATGKQGECPHGSALPNIARGARWHAHTDGGLCLWKDGRARAHIRDFGLEFVAYAIDCINKISVIPRGIDEMMCDTYLGVTGVFALPGIACFQPHKHRLSSLVPALPSPLTRGRPKVTEINATSPQTNRHCTPRLMLVEVCAEVNAPAIRRKRAIKRFLDDHDSLCFVCNEGGRLLCCDDCPRAFHLDCVRPRVDQVPEGEWCCAVCSSDQERAPELRKVLKRARTMMEKQRAVALERTKQRDKQTRARKTRNSSERPTKK
eukprot:c11254_g1_i2.p1 GENE.c11254_g1_i2~~c11254_g1_i2.p1  ORF type:complete len:445 (+),score=75.54 c11254_g1_i2:1-1335(+)